MLIDKKESAARANLRKIAKKLASLTEDQRLLVLGSFPTDDRVILIEMMGEMSTDRPLLKG